MSYSNFDRMALSDNPSELQSATTKQVGGKVVWCALLGLVPGLGLILAPIALVHGARNLRAPGASKRSSIAITLGVLGLLVQVAVVSLLFRTALMNAPAALSGKEEQQPSKPPETSAPSAASQKVPMGDNLLVEILADKSRRVLIDAVVCLREGQLEQLLTRKRTKEHEAILAADIDAFKLHAALLLAGAEAGSPVKYEPRYQPPSGSKIKVTLQYLDKGKLVTVPAQRWVRNVRTGKSLELDWVFAGSKEVDIPDDPNRKYYLANDGDVICVSNFPTALLDLPVKSPEQDADLIFEAFTERIPPLDTKVTVILEVLPEQK